MFIFHLHFFGSCSIPPAGGTRLGVRKPDFLAPPLTNCVTLGRLFNLSISQVQSIKQRDEQTLLLPPRGVARVNTLIVLWAQQMKGTKKSTKNFYVLLTLFYFLWGRESVPAGKLLSLNQRAGTQQVSQDQGLRPGCVYRKYQPTPRFSFL